MRHSLRILCIISASSLILFCSAFSLLPLTNPVVSEGITQSPVQNNTSTFTFKIDPQGATVKDVHITPVPPNQALPFIKKDSNGNEMVEMPDNWVFSRPRGGKSYNFYSGDKGAAIPPEGATFKISVPAKNGMSPLLAMWTVHFTNDGDKKRTTGHICDTTKNGAGHDLLGPIKGLTAWVGPGSRNEAGGFLLINSRTKWLGLAYQVYASKSIAVATQDDTLGIGLNMNDVPTTDWITSTSGMRGAYQVIDDEGFSQTRIDLNDNPEIVGNHLYVVVTLDLNNDGMPDVYNCPPLDIVLFQE